MFCFCFFAFVSGEFFIEKENSNLEHEQEKLRLKSQLQQALESLSIHQLDAPEACHLHSTNETNLGQ